ncbi:MAG: hypothetical protein AAFP16_03665 [Pseudomonadota bacterium]
MTKLVSKAELEQCMLARMSGEEPSSNPFDDMNDEIALVAAAYLVETAAFNLAMSVSTEDTVELIKISKQLSEIAATLGSKQTDALVDQSRSN